MTTPVPISFLVPSYNPGGYLLEAINSVVDQLLPGDEVLVQDGASKDDSIARLRAAHPDAGWLKIVSEKDKGQSDALQRSLLRAENDYVMWLNADDVVYPGALDAIRAQLVSAPDLVIGRSRIFNNDGRVVREYTPRPLTRLAMVGAGADLFTGSIAYRTQLVKDAGGFNADYEYCMDMDVIARIVEREPSIVYIPEVIGGLRWHSESKGGSTLWPIVREATQVRLAHARTPRERALAVRSSSAYLVAGLLLPVRHSRPWSAVHRRLMGRRQTADVAGP